VLKDKGLIYDQTIKLTGAQASKKRPTQPHRIGYKDEATGKRCTFLTKNFKPSDRSIAGIYKTKWRV